MKKLHREKVKGSEMTMDVFFGKFGMILGMPRKLQVECEGAIFTSDQYRELFLKTLVAMCEWKETELSGHRKGDKRKVRMASRLRAKTTMS